MKLGDKVMFKRKVETIVGVKNNTNMFIITCKSGWDYIGTMNISNYKTKGLIEGEKYYYVEISMIKLIRKLKII